MLLESSAKNNESTLCGLAKDDPNSILGVSQWSMKVEEHNFVASK